MCGILWTYVAWLLEGGGRFPKFLDRILARVEIFSDAYPIGHPPNIHVWSFLDICHAPCGREGRCPKFLRQFLAKIAIFSVAYPIFSIRQYPSDSVGFFQVPPIIHVWDYIDTHRVALGGSGLHSSWAKFQLKSKFPSMRIVFLARVGVLQLPWDPATYTCVGFCRNMSRGLWQGGRCPKFPGQIFS